MTVAATIQSEWMSHIEGKPFPDAEHAHLLSTTRGPLVFFINKINRHLLVLKPGASGEQEILDLNLLWELSDNVNCLAVTQALDGSVYLFFALQNKQNGLSGKLYAIEPINPSEFEDETKWKSSLRAYKPALKEGTAATITSITVGSVGVFQRTAAIVYRTENTWNALRLTLHIDYDEGKQTVWLSAEPVDFAGEADASDTPQLLPGRFGRQSGLYFFFANQSVSKLGFRSDSGQSRKFAYPDSDVKAMAVLYDAQHQGHLLVQTSESLIMYDWAEMTYSMSWSKTIAPALQPRKVLEQPSINLKVACTPDSRKSSVWVRAGQRFEDLAYFEAESLFKSTSAENGVKIVPVVRGNVASYSSSATPNGSSLAVLWHRKGGGTNLLERSSTGIWTDSSFEIPAPSVIRTALAYVSHIKLSSTDAAILHNARFLLSSTSSILVLVNDEPLIVDEKPQRVAVDQHGKIEIVNLQQGLQTPQFILANTPDHALLDKPVLLDPAIRVKERLRQSSSPGDLRSLKVGDRNMFAENTDFDQLSLILQNMYKELDALPDDGTRRTDLKDLQDVTVESWDVFHVIQETLNNIQEFVIDQGHFIIKTAGSIIGFVLDCYETALKAINTVLAAAGAALEDLQHWLGFVFDWKEIASTHTSLAHILNITVNTPTHVIEQAFALIETPLASLLKRCSAGVELRNEIKQATSERGLLKKQVSDLRTSNFEPNAIMSHPAIDYVLNKISSLLSAEEIRVELDLGVGFGDAMVGIFGTIRGIGDQLETIVKAISAGQHFTLTQLLESLGEAVLSSLIESLQTMIRKLKAMATKMIRAIPEIMNKPRNIPLWSPLYKYATGSEVDPSLLQITALMIAVPVAICCSVFENTSFPSFTDLVTTDTFRVTETAHLKYIDQTQSENTLPAGSEAPRSAALNDPITDSHLEEHKFTSELSPEPIPRLSKEVYQSPKNAIDELDADTIGISSYSVMKPARLKQMYQNAMPQLDSWRQQQGNTLAWIDLVHTTITTLTIALPELPQLHIVDTDTLDTTTVMIDRLTVINTVIEGFEILASLPMIHNDEWDTTPAVALRFESWAIDSVLKVMRMVATWRAVHDDKAVVWRNSLTVVRNVLAVLMCSLIAEEELRAAAETALDPSTARAAYPDTPDNKATQTATDAAGHDNDTKQPDAPSNDKDKEATTAHSPSPLPPSSKRRNLALWTIPETLVLAASHIAPVAATSATPPNARAVLALTTFSLGLAANASRWSRRAYHGDEDRATFSAGFA